jgi:hypothetical protein
VVVSSDTLEKVVGPRYAGPSSYLSTLAKTIPYLLSMLTATAVATA